MTGEDSDDENGWKWSISCRTSKKTVRLHNELLQLWRLSNCCSYGHEGMEKNHSPQRHTWTLSSNDVLSAVKWEIKDHSISQMSSKVFGIVLHANLRQDHPRMRAFSYACSLPVTWQRWQLHCSIHRTWKPHAVRKRRCFMFGGTGVIADRSFTLRE